MTHANRIAIAPLRGSVSDAEWQARLDLAACYRSCEQFGMSDMIYTHISARLPERADHFLINPNGLMFGGITGPSLLKVTIEGEVLYCPDLPYGLHPAGFTIHSALYRAEIPSAEVAEKSCAMHAPGNSRSDGPLEWQGLVRRIDAVDPSWRE